MKGTGSPGNALAVSMINLCANALLSLVKLSAGLLAHSGALLSDGANSLTDVFSMALVAVGMKMSGKEADDAHPYGHERLECVVALLLSVLVLATGLGIGFGGVQNILLGAKNQLEAPGALALAAAIFSVLAKEALYRYTRAAAKRHSSPALMAAAWDHRCDVFSSLAAFAGVLGARLGLPVLDPIASLLGCALILRAAYSIFRDAVSRMTDRACDEETTARIRALILAQSGVLGLDSLSTRMFGSRIYVDVEIRADGSASLAQAHDIAERVHDSIESALPQVKHCMVHVNPH